MGLELTGKYVSSTYLNLVQHVSDNNYYDGAGNLLTIVDASNLNTSLVSYILNASLSNDFVWNSGYLEVSLGAITGLDLLASNVSVGLAFLTNASLGLAGVVDFTPYATNVSVGLAFLTNASLGLAGVVDFTPYATNTSVGIAFLTNASLGLAFNQYTNASLGLAFNKYTNVSLGLANNIVTNVSLGILSIKSAVDNASIGTINSSLNDTWSITSYINTSSYYDGSINDIRTTYLKKSVPYLSLYDTSTKTAGVSVPRAILWNQEGGKNKIIHKALDSSWGYTVAGDYLMIFSAIGVANSPADHMMFWWTKNGSTNPLPYSNTKAEFVTNNNEKVITVSFITDASVGDYHELMWYASDPADALVSVDASTLPFVYPASPSIILTINLINEY